MKKIIIFLILLLGVGGNAQDGSVGIGTSLPDPSAVLDLVSSNKGLMIPQISLNENNVSDYSFMASVPKESLLIYNTNASFPGGKGIYYWNGVKWVFFFNSANISYLLGITKYYSKIYSAGVSVSSYNSDSGSVGSFVKGTTLGLPWVEIVDGSAFEFTIDRVNNNAVVTFTGMLQLANSNFGSGDFSYGLGIFLDDKLISSKSASMTIDGICAFQEFTITGLAENLTIGNHTIRLGVMNRGSSASGVSVSYGLASTACSNISNDEAKVSAIVLINQPLPY